MWFILIEHYWLNLIVIEVHLVLVMQAYAAASLTSFALFRWAAAKQTSEKQVEIGGAAKRTNLAHMGPTLCYGPTHVMAYAMAKGGPSQGVEVSRVILGLAAI